MHGCQVTCISKYHIPGCIVQDSASIRDCIEVHAHYECFFSSLTWHVSSHPGKLQSFTNLKSGSGMIPMIPSIPGFPERSLHMGHEWGMPWMPAMGYYEQYFMGLYIHFQEKLPSLSHISHHYSHHYPVLYCLVVGLNHPGMESILFFHQIAIRWWILVLIQFHPIYIGTPTATRKNLGPTWTSK